MRRQIGPRKARRRRGRRRVDLLAEQGARSDAFPRNLEADDCFHGCLPCDGCSHHARLRLAHLAHPRAQRDRF